MRGGSSHARCLGAPTMGAYTRVPTGVCAIPTPGPWSLRSPSKAAQACVSTGRRLEREFERSQAHPDPERRSARRTP